MQEQQQVTVSEEVGALMSRILMAEEAGAPQCAARMFVNLTKHVAIPEAKRLVEFERSVWDIKRKHSSS